MHPPAPKTQVTYRLFIQRLDHHVHVQYWISTDGERMRFLQQRCLTPAEFQKAVDWAWANSDRLESEFGIRILAEEVPEGAAAPNPNAEPKKESLNGHW